MEIAFEDIVLRDMRESDIENYIRWFTKETRWMDFDAPWEKEESDAETERKGWTEYYASVKELPENVRRWKFEIEHQSRHVGWVCSYLIDEEYEWIAAQDVKQGQTVHCAVGIDICESSAWGQGIGTKALKAFADYCFDAGEKEIYLQTWSGNERMIRCAHRLGFTECCRKEGIRCVNDERYDGLTFVQRLCSTREHYDLLIEEENDPVHDPKELREYMDRWDGAGFIAEMQLDKSKSVLEIGVGTGRLAIRTAPKCGAFCGIDLSPKTIARAQGNLAGFRHITLLCGDFLSCQVNGTFDVIYSTLTFMHIAEKQKALSKAATLLKNKGRLVLPIDKNPSAYLDMGTRKVRIYPDTAEEIISCIHRAGLTIIRQYETEAAAIFTAVKE
ncbi:MAG: GNAT family N-acetyltransferase [Clostridia bacterium]|nr:GNAT family N-acetyltransferase [Clostridia bacterium]